MLRGAHQRLSLDDEVRDDENSDNNAQGKPASTNNLASAHCCVVHKPYAGKRLCSDPKRTLGDVLSTKESDSATSTASTDPACATETKRILLL